jgi:hypothetical protein
MAKHLRLFGVVALVTGAVASAAAVCLAGPGGAGERVRRLLFVGAPLFEVRRPLTSHEVLRSGSFEVFVGFSPGERVAWDTFRALLNDRDVTGQLTLGRNGVHGRLDGLTEGDNRLRLQIFGRSWWGGAYVQDEQTVVLSVVGRSDWDRALRPRALARAAA